MGAAGEMERRVAVELRAAGRKLVGHAAVFDAIAEIGSFKEVIKRGAFSKAIAAAQAGNADILALVDHSVGDLLGRTKSRTLRLAEDTRGLAFEIDLPQTTLAADLLALAERGDLGGGSFGFLVPPGGERWEGRTRTLTEIDLREISVVHGWPAYAQTSVHARSRTVLDAATRRALARLRMEHLL